jgi:hypothetical protein
VRDFKLQAPQHRTQVAEVPIRTIILVCETGNKTATWAGESVEVLYLADGRRYRLGRL